MNTGVKMADKEQHDSFIKRLKETYPEMFSGYRGGVSIGPGWWPIVEELCRQIDGYLEFRVPPHGCSPVVFSQIKEKFGELCIYYSGGDDVVYGMIRMAEALSRHTCEKCGKPGQTRNNNWISTLCDEHAGN